MKDKKNRVFKFEVAEGQPEGGALVAKGDRGAVRVPQGLDAFTSLHSPFSQFHSWKVIFTAFYKFP